MNKILDEKPASRDVVLEDVWRAKDRLSAAYDHDLDKLLVLTRQNEKLSGRRIVSFEDPVD